MAFVYVGAVGLIGLVKCAYDYVCSGTNVAVTKKICEEIKVFDVNKLKKVQVEHKKENVIAYDPSSWQVEIKTKLAAKFAHV